MRGVDIFSYHRYSSKAYSANAFYQRRRNGNNEDTETYDGIISCNSIGMYNNPDNQRGRRFN